MAKSEKAEKAAKTKKPRVKKDSYLKDNYVPVNTTVEGKVKTVTRAMHIRGIGCNIETKVFEGNQIVSVATNFIPGIKVKTKKDWKYLIKDVPKVKKDKK